MEGCFFSSSSLVTFSVHLHSPPPLFCLFLLLSFIFVVFIFSLRDGHNYVSNTFSTFSSLLAALQGSSNLFPNSNILQYYFNFLYLKLLCSQYLGRRVDNAHIFGIIMEGKILCRNLKCRSLLKNIHVHITSQLVTFTLYSFCSSPSDLALSSGPSLCIEIGLPTRRRNKNLLPFALYWNKGRFIPFSGG